MKMMIMKIPHNVGKKFSIFFQFITMMELQEKDYKEQKAWQFILMNNKIVDVTTNN